MLTKNEAKEIWHNDGFTTAYSGKKKAMFLTANHPEYKGRLIAVVMAMQVSKELLYNNNKFRKALYKQMFSKPINVTTNTAFRTVLL